MKRALVSGIEPLYPCSTSQAPAAAFFGFAITSFQEESLFRGYLQNILTGKVGPSRAILVQAGAFSIAHIGFAPITDIAFFIGAFLTGVLLGALKFYRKTLVAPAVAHGLSWTVLGFMQ